MFPTLTKLEVCLGIGLAWLLLAGLITTVQIIIWVVTKCLA
ncbi:hypothetical protein [Cloacibacillus porcorum]